MAASHRNAGSASPQWGGGPDQQFAPTTRYRKKRKLFRGGQSHRGIMNAPQAPRAMSGQSIGGQQQRARPPDLQRLPPLPTTTNFGSPNLSSTRPGPLPRDHPLKCEMEELKDTRKRRQFYWAGLIEDLGDEESGNPANCDRQRWEDEERKADDKFEQLAGQIKLVEMGFPVGIMESQETSRSGSAGRKRVRNDPPNGPRSRGKRDGRGRDGIQNRRQQYKVPLHQQDRDGRLHANFRGNNPNVPTRRPMVWTKQKQASAVDQWMEEMGMPTSYQKPNHHEHEVVLGGSSASDEDKAGTDAESLREDNFGCPSTLSTPLGFSDASFKRHGSASEYGLATRRVVQRQWTAVEEMAFEEAEREREDQRLLLGRSLVEDEETRTVAGRDGQVVMQPYREATSNVDFGDAILSPQTALETENKDVMSALMSSLDKQRPRTYHETPSKAVEHPVQDVGNHIRNDRASDITPKTVSNPQASNKAELPHQERRRPIASDFMGIEEREIETMDMQNVISSDMSDDNLHEDAHIVTDDEDGFLRLHDTLSPSPLADTKIPINTYTINDPLQNKLEKQFSALGLHYRETLKVDEMFSPSGQLLPPSSDSVAARLRRLRGSFHEYSDKIRQCIANKERGFDTGVAPESVSVWVNTRIWGVDWRSKLDM
ncbi:MAG: hypothetical protein M1830_008765 [Pleopsidium flavum]|nr:MAG: hypothetical protein M1830_008765 [Pleopsidium flavum]